MNVNLGDESLRVATCCDLLRPATGDDNKHKTRPSVHSIVFRTVVGAAACCGLRLVHGLDDRYHGHISRLITSSSFMHSCKEAAPRVVDPAILDRDNNLFTCGRAFGDLVQQLRVQ